MQSAAGISDPIDEAIAMTAGSTKQTSLDMVPVLQQIDEIRSSYEALQQKLRMASEDAQCHNSVSYVTVNMLNLGQMCRENL